MPIVSERIPLGEAAITAAGCTHPEYAVDDDAESDAAFGPPSVIVDAWQSVENTNPQPGQSHSSPFAVVPGSASPRFLRAVWGDDRFITQIRVKAEGDGFIYASVALISSLGIIEQEEAGATGPPPEILLSLPPVPDDDGFYTLDFDFPFYARGVVFYPDADLDTSELAYNEYPTLLLSQLDVFENVEESNAMAVQQATKKRARVGVSEVLIYPWNDGDGPFDNTTVEKLLGLNQFGISTSPKVAVVEGGETVHPIDGFETGRTTKLTVTSAKCSLRALAVLLGGKFAVDAPSGGVGEVQYFAEELADRLPFFRIKAKSTTGNGTDSFVYAKCMIDGDVSYDLEKDKVTDLKFAFMLYFDDTFVRQDGTTGGTREWLHGSKGETTRHS